MEGQRGVGARREVIHDDPPAAGQCLELAHGKWLQYVQHAKADERGQEPLPGLGTREGRDETPRHLVHDDAPRIVLTKNCLCPSRGPDPDCGHGEGGHGKTPRSERDEEKKREGDETSRRAGDHGGKSHAANRGDSPRDSIGEGGRVAHRVRFSGLLRR